jgi:hypothetical protein
MPDSIKKIYKALFISSLFLFYFADSFAQDTIVNSNSNSYKNSYENNKPRFWDRAYFGGGLVLQFGDQTVIQVSPIMGYMLTEKLHVGLGVTYLYYKYIDHYYNYQYESNTYGASVFSKYFIFPEVFAYGEYGIMNMDVYNYLSYEYSRANVASFLIGGGYRQMIGRNAGIELLLLYDLIDDPYSPYTNPVIRMGFVAGF